MAISCHEFLYGEKMKKTKLINQIFKQIFL